jgi:NAD(P)-dependent dehydrogenase (short-subunit alcohol dehydrogenase family)
VADPTHASAPRSASSSVVVVTGAASGIGAATARLAAERGYAVALLDRDGAAAEGLAETLRGNGAAALGIACDVADERAVDDAFATAAAQLGALHGVVASAGIDRSALLHELDATAWDELIGINLRGAFLTCRAALRQLLKAGTGGSIVCVSSPFGFVAPAGGTGAYSASKGGVSALVRSLAVDYGRRGIRVNALLPGPTETPMMWANVADDERAAVHDTVLGEVPLGRLATPEEPARAALWLLSDDASYVTGAQIACDGGVLAKASISV